MKRLLFLLTVVVFFFTSCQEEDQITAKEEVRFTLGVANSANGRTITDFPDNISVEMTVESANGETNMKNIVFRKTGDNYISEPVQMQAGKYKLNDFVIVNQNLAGIPGLLHDFSVSRNDAKNVSIGHAAFQSNSKETLMHCIPLKLKKRVMKFTRIPLNNSNKE